MRDFEQPRRFGWVSAEHESRLFIAWERPTSPLHFLFMWKAAPCPLHGLSCSSQPVRDSTEGWGRCSSLPKPLTEPSVGRGHARTRLLPGCSGGASSNRDLLVAQAPPDPKERQIQPRRDPSRPLSRQHLRGVWPSSIWGWKAGLVPSSSSGAWLLLEGWLQSVLERREGFPQPWEPLDLVQGLLVPSKKLRNGPAVSPRPGVVPSTQPRPLLELALKKGARLTLPCQNHLRPGRRSHSGGKSCC